MFFGDILSMKALQHNVHTKYFFNAKVEEATSTLSEFYLRIFAYRTSCFML